MANDSNIQVRLVAVFWDPGDEDPERTEQFVESALKNATRNIRGTASTATVLYTRDGEFKGEDKSAGKELKQIPQALRDAADEFISKMKQSEENLL
jgi:hypothetical protein